MGRILFIGEVENMDHLLRMLPTLLDADRGTAEQARAITSFSPSALVRMESDDGPQRREVLLIPSENPPVRGQGLLLAIEPNEAPRSTLQGGEVTRVEAERLFVRRECGLVR